MRLRRTVRKSTGADALLWVDPSASPWLNKRAEKLDRDIHGYYFYMFRDDFEHLAGFRSRGRRFHIEVDGIETQDLIHSIMLDDIRPSPNDALEAIVERVAQDVVLDGQIVLAAQLVCV